MEEIHGETLAKAMPGFRERPRQQACNHLLNLLRDYASALAGMHSHCFRSPRHQTAKSDDRPERSRPNHRLWIGGYGRCRNGPFRASQLSRRNSRLLCARSMVKAVVSAGGAISMVSAASCSNRYESCRVAGCSIRSKTHKITTMSSAAALDDIADSIPQVLHEACIEMLQPDPGERPTAMQLARLGMQKSVAVAFSPVKPMHGRSGQYDQLCDWLKTIYSGVTGRLHLYGPSGIGKTRLIDEVENFLKANPYGQVFRARCRPREDQPLQAFDQIASEIANRYMKDDLQRIRLDPVSAGILHEVFPVLKNAVEVSMDFSIPRKHTKSPRCPGGGGADER